MTDDMLITAGKDKPNKGVSDASSKSNIKKRENL